MSFDEEILAESRLSESQELMLYNMSLRQTSQRAAGGREGTHMLLEKVEGSPAYQEMIDRGLLECKRYGYGDVDTASVSLIVTQKGLRYCVLFSSEIEPKRVYNVAGVQRGTASDVVQSSDVGDPYNYAVITSGVALGGSAAKEAAAGLTAEQVARLEEIGAQRRGVDVGRGLPKSSKGQSRVEASGITSGGRKWVSSTGVTWRFAVLGDAAVRIVGVENESRSLCVPTQIEGMPVVEIGSDALADKECVEEIICPDSVERIDSRAFRLNPKLRKLVLSAQVSVFYQNWIDRCSRLEELVLPGLVEEINRGMLANKSIRRLVIGRAVRTVEPGAFQDTYLTEVSISPDNPYIFTDGDAIYSKDGSALLALVRHVEKLVVAPGCSVIARKSCCFSELRKVCLPDSIVEIGAFAFSRSGIEEFCAPASLRQIHEKAFYGCIALRQVQLNDGLETIGDSAFEGADIGALEVPATIKRLGKSMTKGTRVVHSGPGCTLSIDEKCEDLLLDGAGGLYRLHDDGWHLVQLVDGNLETYAVRDGSVAVDPYAFAYHDNICTVRIAETVRTIGQSAFRVCRNLRHVDLPDSVESIGDEAFYDTSLEEFHVPAGLSDLGERALVTYGAHHGGKLPSLSRIDVAPENEMFYMASGMLCRKLASGSCVVVFTGSELRVVFPDEVTRIEEYAFSNARGIEYLALNPRLSTIGTSGLSTRCWIRQIHVELPQPLEGRNVFDFFFPDTPGAVRGIALGLGGASWVNVPGIMEQLDLCLVSARDYNVPGKSDNISAYAQAKLILDRLDDPVMLTPHNKTMMERLLRSNIEDICVDVALYDDRSVLDELVDRGFVNAENFEAVIARVGTLRDAATSAYLLETKRQRFAGEAFDYDL